MNTLLSTTLLTLLSLNAIAQTPEGKGLAIAREAEKRDQGYTNHTVESKMVLRNASGQTSERLMRQMAFEIISDEVGDKSLVIFDKPLDVKGTAFLTHSNILEADNQWLYLPKLGKVKRISSRNKSGPFMGSEFSYEDMSTAEVNKYTYKYISEEPCGEHSGGLTCFKVERFPQYKYSGYTKQIVWMDTADYRTYKIESYDRKKSLLKTLTAHNFKKYAGKHWRPDFVKMVNHQTGKSTDLYWSNHQFKTDLQEKDFNKAVLKNIR